MRRVVTIAATALALTGAALAATTVLVLSESVRGLSAEWYHLHPISIVAIGAVCWYRSRLGGRSAVARGVRAGLVASCAGLYVGTYAEGVWSWFANKRDPTSQLDSFGQPPVDPLTALPMALGLWVGELLVVGWLIIPLGVLFGAALGRVLGWFEDTLERWLDAREERK